MKTHIHPRLLCLCAVLFLTAVAMPAGAQQYAITWYKVSGGGGGSTNAPYAINGTIGQHDAGGPMTSGAYTLMGGFWSMVTVQSPGAPLLTIQLIAPNTALVSWPAPSQGFVLQQNPNLGTTNWVNVVNPVTVLNGRNQVTINPTPGNVYYRLINP